MRVGVGLAVCVLVVASSFAVASVELRSADRDPAAAANPASEVNATLAFERVERLTGERAPRPRIVVERDDVPFDPTENAFDPFFALFANVTRTPVHDVAASTDGETVRLLVTDGATPVAVEQSLVHEYAHVLQPRDLERRLLDRAGDYAATTDGTLAQYGVVEGAAVYVTARYTDRHLPDADRPVERLRRAWTGWSGANRLLWGPYVFGADHVADRVASPRNLSAVYERPPRTTEQLAHGLTPDEEPRRALSVAVRDDDSAWTAGRTDTRGELYARVLLESGLPRERAADAATGWGMDRHVTFDARNRTGYAWVLRWDDAANATTFERAAPASFKPDAGDVAARSVRVAPETVAVLAGDPGFVADARVAGGNATVVVTPPDRATATARA